MRLHKTLLFTSIIPLLISCNANDIAGIYSFQLGKDTGTHFGIQLKLSNKYYVPAEGESVPAKTYKEFNLTMSAKFPQEDGGGIGETIDSILSYFTEGIPGYYQLTSEKNRRGEQRLKIGLSYAEIFKTIKNAYEGTAGMPLPEETVEALNVLNDSKIIESLLYATYKDSTVNLYVPVSMDDLYYQLYWYGVDIKVKSFFDFEVVYFDGHPIGTNPTQEEVDEINQTFPAEHEGCQFTTYRAFNQLQMGLAKK